MAATIPFRGFTPSVDPTTPGAVLDCKNMVPTLRGMRAASTPSPISTDPFPDPVTGAATCELLSGSYRTIVGTAQKLYEVLDATHSDVSGMAYTGGANRWRFAQFGNATLGVNGAGANPLQQSVNTGKFGSIAGAPSGSIVEVVQGFVFLLDTTDETDGHRPNGWFCSGIYNQTIWTPSQATQCAKGAIIDTPGKVTAGRALGTNIVVYKKSSMFYGTYQGPPVIWAMNLISPIVGTPCQEAVVAIGTRHVFLGSDAQVYSYDGATVTPIGDEVHEWLASNWSKRYRDRVESYHDKDNELVYWYFVSGNSSDGMPDTCLVLNYRTGKFGRADAKIESSVVFISGQITWDSLGSLPDVSTWDTLPKIPYNSAFWMQASEIPAIVDTNHRLQSLSGVSEVSSLTTGWFGDDFEFMYVQGVVPRFASRPTACTGSARMLSSLGGDSEAAPLGDMYDGELGADFSCRYAQVILNFTGNHEILGAVPRVVSAGSI
ncbi:hypothetical protein WJ60_09815 [Burkholderia ubonensis]|uniref:hypothetical protein n=1 Tax=Burkholderia ubonensis TaxID=101571 RepID=UPI000752EEAD|nr:hypothetical protein [Burkholderia ubonensis]KVM70123.1 hypothetical protein WJ60_09815 [Burkholderia ubonensis]